MFNMEIRSTVFREPNLFSVKIFCAVLGIPLCVSECVANDLLSLLGPCNGHRQEEHIYFDVAVTLLVE
jgi:hypothetical protein